MRITWRILLWRHGLSIMLGVSLSCPLFYFAPLSIRLVHSLTVILPSIVLWAMWMYLVSKYRIEGDLPEVKEYRERVRTQLYPDPIKRRIIYKWEYENDYQ